MYVGDSTRLGVGWDSENQLRGDLWQVFGEDERSAWIGELWLTRTRPAAARSRTNGVPKERPPTRACRKFFGAFDQNSSHNRKVTLGGGYETERWFASGYVSAGISGRRETGVSTSSSTTTRVGEDNGRPYEQDITTTVVATTYERAYDWGIGGRVGHFYPGPLLRLEAGLDYEGGKKLDRAAATASLSLANTSPAAAASHSPARSTTSTAAPNDRDDGRVWVMYRYTLDSPSAWRPREGLPHGGGADRDPACAPAAPATSAPAVTTAAAPATPRSRHRERIVETTATATRTLSSSSTARRCSPPRRRPSTRRSRASRRRASRATSASPATPATSAPTRTTCSSRSVARTRCATTSWRRACRPRACSPKAWADAHPLREHAGAEGQEPPRGHRVRHLRGEGRDGHAARACRAGPGCTGSAAAARGAERRGRAGSSVEWRREEIASEPTWLRRALRNAPGHKQSVDVYQTQSDTTTVAEGPKRYLNRNPVARNDTATVEADSTARPIDVLANDTDPDGDTIVITAVGTPAHGTATISGRQVLYTPTPGYLGADTFTYTIDDGKGARSTASVAVTVARANRAPDARDDFAIAGYNQPVSIDVLGNDSDPDGDPLVIVSFTQAQNGSVTRGPGNKLTYLSAPNYIGYDNFTYEVSDGKGGTSRASVVVFADP